MNPDEELAAELRKFDANKSNWSNEKCTEIQNLLTLANQYPLTSTITNLTLLNWSARLLCSGPKFDENQAQCKAFSQQLKFACPNTSISA